MIFRECFYSTSTLVESLGSLPAQLTLPFVASERGRRDEARGGAQMLQADKQVLLAGVKRSALELRQKEVAPLRSRLASFPRSPI